MTGGVRLAQAIGIGAAREEPIEDPDHRLRGGLRGLVHELDLAAPGQQARLRRVGNDAGAAGLARERDRLEGDGAGFAPGHADAEFDESRDGNAGGVHKPTGAQARLTLSLH